MNYPPIPPPSAPGPIDMVKEAVDWLRILERVRASKGKVLPWLARQVHSTTGHLPGLRQMDPAAQKSFLKQIRAGEYLGGSRLAKAKSELMKFRGTSKEPSALRSLYQAQKEVEWGKLTGGTIPGVIKAMAGGKAMPVLRAGWNTMPGWGKGLVGYMGYTGARDVLNTPDWMYGQPGFPYKSRLQHLGRELGSNVGYIAAGGLPAIPMIAGSYAAERLGGLPGRLTAGRARPIPPEILAQMGG